jgi:hypothetical protein
MHSKSNIQALTATFHGLTSPKRVLSQKTLRGSFCDFNSPEVPLARTSSSKSSRLGVVGLSPQFDSENLLQYKVLRFWQVGQYSPPHLVRIKREARFGGSLAANGDALIHGPNLVAWPVGSEWRNHRLHRAVIQTNQ